MNVFDEDLNYMRLDGRQDEDFLMLIIKAIGQNVILRQR